MQPGRFKKQTRPAQRSYTSSNYTNGKEWCHVQIYEKYMSLCPKDGPDNAFYLIALRNPRENVWFSRNAVGHNTLHTIIPDMCNDAGIKGNY